MRYLEIIHADKDEYCEVCAYPFDTHQAVYVARTGGPVFCVYCSKRCAAEHLNDVDLIVLNPMKEKSLP